MLDNTPDIKVSGGGAVAAPLHQDALPSKEEMAEILLARGQFLVGEQGKMIRNGLSTDLILFPSDCKTEHADHLANKVEDAIEFATSFLDVERLNALQYVPGAFRAGAKSQERWYLTLGLYLYFADECSRKNPGTTFLTALREADARLKAGEDFSQRDLYKRVRLALRKTGIATPENRRILHEWASEGIYRINGEKHEGRGDGTVEGAYAELAQEILKEYHHFHRNGKIVGINEAVSYALGNMDEMHSLDDLTAFQHTRNTINNPQRIKQRIDKGDMERRRVLWKHIHDAFTPLEIEGRAGDKRKAREIAEHIVAYFPSEALELMLRERYTFVYDDRENVSGIYPTGKIAGYTGRSSEESRKGAGVRLSRYRTMFVANGQHEESMAPDVELKYQRVAQTVLHETMHMALDHLTEAERDALYTMAEQVSDALREGKTEEVRPVFPYRYLGDSWGKDLLLEKRKLAEILDFRSELYDGYKDQYVSNKPDSPDMRREEVICNVFGLLHTEFANHQDPHNPLFFPVEGIAIVKDFVRAVEEAYKKGVRNLRNQQETKGITLPQASAVQQVMP